MASQLRQIMALGGANADVNNSRQLQDLNQQFNSTAAQFNSTLAESQDASPIVYSALRGSSKKPKKTPAPTTLAPTKHPTKKGQHPPTARPTARPTTPHTTIGPTHKPVPSSAPTHAVTTKPPVAASIDFSEQPWTSSGKSAPYQHGYMMDLPKDSSSSKTTYIKASLPAGSSSSTEYMMQIGNDPNWAINAIWSHNEIKLSVGKSVPIHIAPNGGHYMPVECNCMGGFMLKDSSGAIVNSGQVFGPGEKDVVFEITRWNNPDESGKGPFQIIAVNVMSTNGKIELGFETTAYDPDITKHWDRLFFKTNKPGVSVAVTDGFDIKSTYRRLDESGKNHKM
jgi:hypothetical protein